MSPVGFHGSGQAIHIWDGEDDAIHIARVDQRAGGGIVTTLCNQAATDRPMPSLWGPGHLRAVSLADWYRTPELDWMSGCWTCIDAAKRLEPIPEHRAEPGIVGDAA